VNQCLEATNVLSDGRSIRERVMDHQCGSGWSGEAYECSHCAHRMPGQVNPCSQYHLLMSPNLETVSGARIWRRDLEMGSGDGIWRRDLETGSGDGIKKRDLETESGDRIWIHQA
jgi:hypothetical protein